MINISESNDKDRKATTPVIIALDLYSNNDMAKTLHPDFKYSYKTFIGNIYSIGNAMRYIAFNNFKPEWLDKKLDDKNIKALRNGGNREVSQYWGLVRLLLADRILSDKVLINKILAIEDVKNIKFTSLIKQNKGILEATYVVNKKHIVYCKFLSDILITITEAFKDCKEDITQMDNRTYKTIKTNIKVGIFEDVLKRSGPDHAILESFSNKTNDELKEVYLR